MARIDCPKYRAKLKELAKNFTSYEIAEQLNIPRPSISRDLRSMQVQSKGRFSSLDPWKETIAELYGEGMPVKVLAEKMETTVQRMYRFIKENKLKRYVHPAVDQLEEVSLAKIYTGQYPIYGATHIPRKDGNHLIIIPQSDFCALWDRANEVADQHEPETA